MTTLSSHHAPEDNGHGVLTGRRVTAAVAVFVMIVSAPLVVRALADSNEENGLSTEGAVVLPDESSVESKAGAPLDDRAIPTTSRSDDLGATEADAPVVDTPDGQPAEADAPRDPVPDDIRRDRVAPPPLDIHALLTDSYSWEERSLRVAALQQVLNAGVDGWYSADTRLIHLQFMEFVGLSTDGIPDVAPPGPSAEEWAALRDCESGGDYSIASSSGRYRGAYQFARTTWDNVAEQHNPSLVGVDPATAAPADQDAMALALYRQAGAGPWPVCGRHLS